MVNEIWHGCDTSFRPKSKLNLQLRLHFQLNNQCVAVHIAICVGCVLRMASRVVSVCGRGVGKRASAIANQERAIMATQRLSLASARVR